MLRAVLRRVCPLLQAEEVRFLPIGFWNGGLGFQVFAGFFILFGEGQYWLAFIFSRIISSGLPVGLYRCWVARLSWVALAKFLGQQYFSLSRRNATRD
jgi:hypothetical protein